MTVVPYILSIIFSLVLSWYLMNVNGDDDGEDWNISSSETFVSHV